MKRFVTLFLIGTAILAISCGNNSKKKTPAPEGGDEVVEMTESASAETPAPKKEEPKAPAKKWYEQDFSLTEVMYVGKNGIKRTYARKGNVLIGTQPGSPITTLFVCTDSTRTEYKIGNEKKVYSKVGEKSGFASVDDAVYKYLKSQMSETVFGKQWKKGDEGITARDTVIFGRPAYVLTKETLEKNSIVEVWGKGILYVDKENGLPYYKWAIIKNNGKVITEGKSFEITDFSADPTFEGLIMSLDGLTAL